MTGSVKNGTNNSNTNLYIVIVAVMGILSIAVMWIISPSQTAVQIPIVFSLVASVIALLQKQKETDRKADNAAVAAEKSQTGIDAIHTLTNSKNDALIQKQDIMVAKIIELEKTIAAMGATAAEKAEESKGTRTGSI